MAIQIRRGNDAEWESNKSNIVAGEPAVAMDSERMFVGTGSGTYMELANIDVLADAFDSSASYEVGDFVAYHGKVYKFNTDHSGAWNASDVDEVALADALDSLGEDVYTKAEADALLTLKADASDVNSALALKADKSDTYTKAQVDASFADIITKGINLFNPNDPDLVENVELLGDGTTATKTGYFASGFIPVEKGKTVCCHYPVGTYGASSKLVFYDSNKQRTGYTSVPSADRLVDANGHNYIRYTFTENSTTAYFRLTGYMSGESYYMYVYASTMPSTYEPYMPYDLLSDNVKVKYENIIDVSVSKDDTDFVKSKPQNLTDISAMQTGVIGNSSSNGDLDSTVTTWVSTDFIPVKPNTTYSLVVAFGVYYGVNYRGIPYYSADKTYMGRVAPNEGKTSTAELRTITIPNNDQIAYIRNSYPIAYKTNHKLWYNTMIIEGSTWVGNALIPYDDTVNLQGAGISKEYATPLNCLSNKFAMWNGDSICAADNEPQGGWPIRIAKANGMQARNYGVAGGTIAENTGSNVHSVSATLDYMITAFPNADYIIIEGGTNDADILGDAGIGTFDADDFTDAYIEALDKNTFSGALESIFYRLVTQMKGKHIGYLIPQKMGHTEVLVARRRTYFDRAKAIAQKWGIPVLDLWNELYFNWRLTAHWDPTMTSAENNAANNFYLDGQHLTDYGYEVQSPIIAEWMKTI